MFARTALLLCALLPLASSFHAPLVPLRSAAATRSTCDGAAMLRAQMPDAPVKIPDTFNPAEWGKGGGGGGGLGGDFKIPDSFNPAQFEAEKKAGAVGLLERPTQKTDPGKKYKVLLFNDEQNTRQYVTSVLVNYIPGMDKETAKRITEEAHTTGMSIVGVWMFEMAEGYSDILRSQGLKSDIAEE
eukprot:638521-Rhodomonas_salina.1